MNISTIIKIEYTKLFRRSNVLFLFLFLYLMLTPIQMIPHQFIGDSSVNYFDLLKPTLRYISIFGMLLMAIFLVNNTGNDFNEGSYRKNLAVGLTKKDYFTGKLLLIFFFSIFVIVFTIFSYLLLGKLAYKLSLYSLFKEMMSVNLLNQFLALFNAGLFGLFFITVFRNRIIGLVFFPFWLITEFSAFLLEKSETLRLYTHFWPGQAGFNLYNSLVFDLEALLIIIVISIIFVTSAWLGLLWREEKS